jgi:hypothetical protein
MGRNDAGSSIGYHRARDRFRRDLALAIRALRRTPGFTVAVVAILGLGIGMSTATFTVYRSVLVTRLPVADQDRLIVAHPLDLGGAHLDVPFPYLKNIQRENGRTLRAVAGVYHLGALPAPLTEARRSSSGKRSCRRTSSTCWVHGRFLDA